MNKISVIVPIYNAEKQLRKCVDSLLNQTYGNVEIILVDDESPDKSPAICDEYAEEHENVKVIHKQNGGASAARNTGLLAATGEYIHFVDADDWIEPETYTDIVGRMDEAEADVAFFGWYVDIPEKKKITAVSQADNAPDGVFGQDEIFKEMLIICGSAGGKVGYGNYIWNKAYRRSKLLDKDGNIILFDETVKVAEDGLWLMYVGQNWQKGVMAPKSYYHYLRNSSSVMNTVGKYCETRLASQASHIKMLEILREFNEEYFIIHRDACTEFFWSTTKSQQGSGSQAFIAQVITNLVTINDGVCPINVARDVQWYIRNKNSDKDVLNRRTVKAAIKLSNGLRKLRGKGNQ